MCIICANGRGNTHLVAEVDVLRDEQYALHPVEERDPADEFVFLELDDLEVVAFQLVKELLHIPRDGPHQFLASAGMPPRVTERGEAKHMT